MHEISAELVRARALTVRSAQLLTLLGFSIGPGRPILGPAISTYHDMLAPDTTDERRFAACRRYLEPVGCYAELEELRDEPVGRHMVDPYRLALRTTLRGALLQIIATDHADIDVDHVHDILQMLQTVPLTAVVNVIHVKNTMAHQHLADLRINSVADEFDVESGA